MRRFQSAMTSGYLLLGMHSPHVSASRGRNGPWFQLPGHSNWHLACKYKIGRQSLVENKTANVPEWRQTVVPDASCRGQECQESDAEGIPGVVPAAAQKTCVPTPPQLPTSAVVARTKPKHVYISLTLWTLMAIKVAGILSHINPTRMMQWCYWQGNGLAIRRLQVRVLAGHHCVVALGKLLTPVCRCHQAV